MFKNWSLPLNFTYACRKSDHLDRTPHSHSDLELVFFKEGHIELGMKGWQSKGTDGSLFLLPAHLPHYQKSFSHMESYSIRFETFGHLPVQPFKITDKVKDSWTLGWIKDLNEIYNSDVFRSGAGDGITYSLLQRIGFTRLLANPETQYHPVLQNALSLMDKHLSNPLSLDELAFQTCASRSTLKHVFHHYFSHGPMHHYQILKIEAAGRLLRENPFVPIQQIAFQTGFTDSNYFTRVFKNRMGKSPSRYRLDSGPIPVRPGLKKHK